MKLIKPNFEIITQNPNNDGMLKHIELCGRVCYKSEDKIKDNTAAIFVNGLIKSGHTSVLEHGTVYLYIRDKSYNVIPLYEKYKENKYSKVNLPRCNEYDSECYITTNYRVLVENNWLDDLQYQCEPTEFHEKRVTVKFHTQIAITREGNRHRVNSVTESSTRYCNYSKDKFGGELTINCPDNITEELLKKANPYSSIIAIKDDEYGTLYEKETYQWLDIDWWLWANSCSELAYLKLIEKGWTAQQARTILPLDTNTEVIYTAFISDWKHFFELRTAKGAHVDIRNLAIPLEEEFKKLNLI